MHAYTIYECMHLCMYVRMHVCIHVRYCAQKTLQHAELIITASHQTFSGQFWYLSGQDLTHLLYIINGKVSVFLEDKVMSGQISTLIINTDMFANLLVHFVRINHIASCSRASHDI